MIVKHRWLMLAGAAGVAIAVLYLARATVLPAVGDWLDVSGPPQKADAVLLLSGNANTRPFAAAALVNAGWAPRVFLVRTAPSPSVEQGIVPPWHELNRQILLRGGVPEKDILILDGSARSTYDEAVAMAQFLESSPKIRLLVVTDGPHTRRARWIVSRLLGDHVEQLTMITSPSERWRSDGWWRNAEGFGFVVSEYLKLAFYGIRYGWLGYAAIGLISILLVIRIFRRICVHGRGAPESADSDG